MAVARAFVPFDMFNQDVIVGTVTERTSSTIEITAGGFVARYGGSFSYDAYGVYGQVHSIATSYNGRALISVTDFTVDAYRFANAVGSGDAEAVMAMVLGGDDDIHGSSAHDVLRGFTGSDDIWGKGGNDRILGERGNDRLYAGTGADKLAGGRGADHLWGGTDAAGDDFVFLSRNDSGTGAKRDVIHNFTRGADDIDLRGIDARAGGANERFDYSGQKAAAFSVWWKAVDAGVMVRADVNGDARADLEILVDGPLVRLGEGDFLL